MTAFAKNQFELLDYVEDETSDLNFDDPEDFIDDIDDESLIPDILEKKPQKSDEIDSVIVVDGIPTVSSEKLPKLKDVIRKIYGKIGEVINEHYPLSKEKKTKGYCFLELESYQCAMEAIRITNKHVLDKNHTLMVFPLSDFDKYENIPSNWEPPVEQPFPNYGSLKYFLLEQDACDQYVVLTKGGNEVGVYLNSVKGISNPTEIEVRANWTQRDVKWSPMGSFLATCHLQGIRIWGSEEFRSISKFIHNGVQFFEFSPSERYLVTSNQSEYCTRNERKIDQETSKIVIWETRTGLKKRVFKAEKYFYYRWPVFKWSHNDRFFAALSKDGSLSVYDSEDFNLLDKKSITVKGIQDFSWSPTDDTLAYWVAEDNAAPARVVILEMPSKSVIRSKNLFNVADCKMFWQKGGSFLCVKIDRYSKIISTKQKDDDSKCRPQYVGLFYNFEIFHMKEKEIPVDSIEIKEDVHAFAWEPMRTKFAIIHGDVQALNVSFYEMKTGHTPVLKKKYERKTANMLYWSPQGRYVVLAGFRKQAGTIECIDTMDFTVMGSGEHFNCTDVEWDPTGRYFMTGVSWWKYEVDNAYWLWSFQGKVLQRFKSGGFCQLLWRPRPPSVLSPQEVKQLKRSLEEYSNSFDAIDRARGNKKSMEELKKRRKLYDDWMKYRELTKQKVVEEKMKNVSLRNGHDTDNDKGYETDMEEESIEIFVKEEIFEVAM